MLFDIGTDNLMKVTDYLRPADIFHLRQADPMSPAITRNDATFTYHLRLYSINRDGSHSTYKIAEKTNVLNDVPRALTYCLRKSITRKLEEAFNRVNLTNMLDFVRDINQFGTNHVIITGSLMVRVVTGKEFDNTDIDFFCDKIGAHTIRDYLIACGYEQTNCGGSYPIHCAKMSKRQPNGREAKIDVIYCREKGVTCQDMTDNFDMLICACSFDGYFTSVPMPINTFSGTTVLNKKIQIPFQRLVYLTERIPRLTREASKTYGLKSRRLRDVWKRDYHNARRTLVRIKKYERRGIRVLMRHRMDDIEDGMDLLKILMYNVGRRSAEI